MKRHGKTKRMKAFLKWWTKTVQSPHLINNEEFERIMQKI